MFKICVTGHAQFKVIVQEKMADKTVLDMFSLYPKDSSDSLACFSLKVLAAAKEKKNILKVD